MKRTEQGFLLLTSHLGDPDSRPLTVAGFRRLLLRVQTGEKQQEKRALELKDLIALGYSRAEGQNILDLLAREELLDYYVSRGRRQGCIPATRVTEGYPNAFREKLGVDCPGCIWLKGDTTLLRKPAVTLVGSRELQEENSSFAAEAGRQAAKQGYVLISGNARGADRIAQDSCLENGGQVISIVADSLLKCKDRPGMLYMSEDGYDHSFSAIRALSRNRLIHTLGKMTLVAQCTKGKGGTWRGCVDNLRHGWSPVYCFQDGSDGTAQLCSMGATPVDIFDLSRLDDLQNPELSLFE